VLKIDFIDDPDLMLPLTPAECDKEIETLRELVRNPLLVRMFSRFYVELEAINNAINEAPSDVAAILIRERLFGQRKTLSSLLGMFRDEVDILVAQKLDVENSVSNNTNDE
jgi:hypothetical protein